MKILNAAGIFTGEGFHRKQGRKPNFEDCGYQANPADIEIDHRVGESFDASGLVVTPGFVDSHTHTLFAGVRSQEFFLRWRGADYAEIAAAGGGIHNSNRETSERSEAESIEDLFSKLSRMARSGSTTVEIKTGYGATSEGELHLLRVLKKFRTSIEERKSANLPDFRVTFLGLHALPTGIKESDYVDSMISILPVIQEEKLADYVDAFPEKGFFSLSESLRFARAGEKVGLRVKIHSEEMSTLGSAEAFSEEGALSVDHLQKIGPRGVDALGKSMTVATLMPATSFYLGIEYSNARRLIDAGVRVALATDYNPGTAPNSDMLFSQLLAASQFKMSPAEILCASTYNGAQAMGLLDRGFLGKGQRADLLCWSFPQGIKSGERALEDILLGQAKLEKVFVSGHLCG